MEQALREDARRQELARRIEEHPLWRRPAAERLADAAQWQDLYLLVMRWKGFLQKVENRLQSRDSALALDENELLNARYSRAGRRRSLYDSCAFAESLRAAVKGYDPDRGGSFLAYFDAIYEKDLHRAANREQGKRQEGARPLTRGETNLWKELCRLTEKLGLDARQLPPGYYATLADLLGVSREQVERLLRRCSAARWVTSLDRDGEEEPAPEPEDPAARAELEQLELAQEAMGAIALFAERDAAEYPRLFFTNDVLAPMRAEPPQVDPASYCALLERQEALLWQRVFVRGYVEYVFQPPPAPDTLRHLLLARLCRPLRDATIAAFKGVTPAAVSYRRKRYAAAMRALAADQRG